MRGVDKGDQRKIAAWVDARLKSSRHEADDHKDYGLHWNKIKKADDWALLTVNTAAGWAQYGDTANFETLGYFKSWDGTVYLKGLFAAAGVPTAATIATGLPEQYRPSRIRIFCMNTAAGAIRIDVNPAGAVLYGGTLAALAYGSLDGIAFRAEQ